MSESISRYFHSMPNSFAYGTQTNLKSKPSPYVEGYITTEDIDLQDEVMTKSAMDEIVTELKSGRVKLDIEHSLFKSPEPEIPIGRIVDARLDELHGKSRIWVKALLNEAHSKFNETWKSIKDGMIDAFSVAYKTQDRESAVMQGKTVTLLKSVKILNVALTGNPVNQAATIEDFYMKSLKANTDEDKNILMSHSDFVAEHEKLIKILESGTPEEQKKEAEEQKKELESYKSVKGMDANLKHRYVKREGSPGNYTYIYPEDLEGGERSKKQEDKKESKVTHENAVSIIKKLYGTNEQRQTAMLENLSNEDLEFIRSTADKNIYGGNEYSQKYSREAIVTISKELNSRKKEKKKEPENKLSEEGEKKKQKWVEATLRNDEDSSDSELLAYFIQEGKMTKDEAMHYLDQRDNLMSRTSGNLTPYKQGQETDPDALMDKNRGAWNSLQMAQDDKVEISQLAKEFYPSQLRAAIPYTKQKEIKDRLEDAAKMSEQNDIIDDLDSIEKDAYDKYMKKEKDTPENRDKALEMIANTVEGDESQLSDKLAEYAKKKGWLEGFDPDLNDTKSMGGKTMAEDEDKKKKEDSELDADKKACKKAVGEEEEEKKEDKKDEEEEKKKEDEMKSLKGEIASLKSMVEELNKKLDEPVLKSLAMKKDAAPKGDIKVKSILSLI